jgi:uncharacterized membrane protein required for colicin V production
MDSLPQLSLIDMIAILLVAAGGIQGFFRGLSGEIARLVGTILAFFAGVWLREPVGAWIVENTRLEDRAATATAFTATVILALLIMLVVRMVIKRLVKVVFAEGFDKSMGVFAGLLRMSIIVLIIFLCMNLIPHDYLNRVFGEESAIGRVVVKYVPMVRDALEENNLLKPSDKGQQSKKEEDSDDTI